MIKIFVDSASSIKREEADKYGVEVLPLKINLDGREYSDGVDIDAETFYSALINKKIFPKTSLPSLDEAEERINKCVSQGYEVILLAMSAGISGTYNAMKMLFCDNPKVRVIDTQTAVGGIKLLVLEANKYLDKSADFVEKKIKELIPRVKILAVPETLNYLHKGGRLSAVSWAVGSVLRIKPVIELKNTVKVAGKTLGLKIAMKFIISALEKCDLDYPIVPSYTYDEKNLQTLISVTDEKYKKVMTEFDDIALSVSAHWGPNAFGYIFIEKTN